MRWGVDTSRSSGFALAAVPLLLGLCLPTVSLAQDGPSEDENLRTWVSRAKGLDALTEEVVTLYSALQEAGALDTTMHSNEMGETAEELLRSSGLYYGTYLPKRMEGILCSLNGAHCHSRSRSGEITYRWTNPAKAPIVLPRITFEKGYGKLLYTKKENEQLAAYVVEELGGCTVFDDECRDRIAEMNGGDRKVVETEYAGLLWLPVLRLSTQLNVEERPVLIKSLDRNLIPRASAEIPARPSERVDEIKDPSWQATSWISNFRTSGTLGDMEYRPSSRRWHEGNLRFFREHEQSQDCCGMDSMEGVSFLASHGVAQYRRELISVGYLTKHPESLASLESHSSYGTATMAPLTQLKMLAELTDRSKMAETQRLIFDLISAPGPTELRSGGPPVAVLDSFTDGEHCAFGKRVTVDNLDPADDLLKGVDRSRCGVPSSNVDEDLDHGTHVVGLIAAGECPAGDAETLRGVNPSGWVEAFQLRIDSKNFDIVGATNRVELATQRRPRVINFSFYYEPVVGEGSNDTVALLLKELEDSSVVVAAAGKKGQRHDGPCVPLPACSELKNVISVAALDLSRETPRVLKDSDYGPRVHLGAPAAGVPSTVRANRLGQLTGTSQAAPLVAGAASLLLGKYGSLDPWQVRNRLVYSSDLFPSLEEQLLGGRLNIRRALDFDDDLMTLAPGTELRTTDGMTRLKEKTTLRGRVDSLYHDTPNSERQKDMEFKIRRPETQAENWTNLGLRVRRMVVDPSGHHLFTFLIEDANTRALSKTKAFLESPSLWVAMMLRDPETGRLSEVRFQMRGIQDYMARLLW